MRYNGFNDYRGGGHFSGRLTAPIVFAGAICRQILEKKGIKVVSHIKSIKEIEDSSFDYTNIEDNLIERLSYSDFPLIDESLEDEMKAEIPKEMYIALEGEVLESPGWGEGIPDEIIPIFDKLCEALDEE